jgi:hypothetical protein
MNRIARGCIVCGISMGGEADPLRCHDCVEEQSMVDCGNPPMLIGLTETGPVALNVERIAAALSYCGLELPGPREAVLQDAAALRERLLEGLT